MPLREAGQLLAGLDALGGDAETKARHRSTMAPTMRCRVPRRRAMMKLRRFDGLDR